MTRLMEMLCKVLAAIGWPYWGPCRNVNYLGYEDDDLTDTGEDYL